MFAVGNQMNRRQTVEAVLDNMSSATSFRACFGCLVDPLLAAERVVGLFMIVRTKPT